jgi:UDP-2,4-diacetamido-2,4,6-trideoxy-beta-L-altropyranose hydrolase
VTKGVAVFRADGGPAAGAGHVTRCIALAEAMEAVGWKIVFAVGADTLNMIPSLMARKPDTVVLQDGEWTDWGSLRRAIPNGCDTLVIDHYGTESAYERALSGWARHLVVIDDATSRRHECDVLLDSGTVDPKTYLDLVPEGTKLLLGPQHALVRRSFLDHRPRALARRARRRAIGSVLISFGSTDTTNATCAAIDALNGLVGHARISVALSAQAPHLADVQRRMQLCGRLYIDAGNMPELMTEADLAIGASGATAFERAVLGLPTIMVLAADNQRAIHRLMLEAGAAEDGGLLDDGFAQRVATLVRELASDADHCHRISQSASDLVDGLGPHRVVDALM